MFDMILVSFGRDKISIVKEVLHITKLGLKGSKDLVDTAPSTILKKVSREKAEAAKKQLERAGATVEIKSSE